MRIQTGMANMESDVEFTFNSNWDPLMPSRGWRLTASDPSVFHMLVLSPASKSVQGFSDLMWRIEQQQKYGYGNGTGMPWSGAVATKVANETDENLENWEWVEYWVMCLGIWQLILACIGTPLNIWILYIWFHYGQSGSHNRFRTSRQISNHWFVASMTFADLLTTGFHSPAIAAWYLFGVQYNPEFCLSLVAVTHAASTASSLSLLCLNVDKFLYMTYSLKYELYVTKYRAITATAVCWTLSIGWAVIFVTTFMDNVEHGCSYGEIDTISYVVFSVGFFILPTVLSLLISIQITVIVSRYIGTPKRSDSMLHTNTSSGDRRIVPLSYKSKCRPLKRIAFIFTTTAWSVVTCLPYRFLFMLRKVWVPDPFSPWRYIFYGAMSANAAGNPIITLFTLKLYRSCTVKLFKKFAHRGGGAR